MEKHLLFKPLIKSGHYQTIMSLFCNFTPELSSTTTHVKLPDGDALAIEISTPPNWKEEDGIAIFVHGLCGSHKSNYMNRLATRSYRKGRKAVRVNLRSCGSGQGLSRLIYHNGCSPDIGVVLRYLRQHFSRAPMILAGFSFGASLVLKIVGDLGKEAVGLLCGAIAVSPPIDPISSTRLLLQPSNQVYANYFLRRIIEDINYIHDNFPDLPPHDLPSDMTIRDCDELYFAPRAKFANVLDYYHSTSAKRVIHQIAIPTNILLAQDDPLILSTSFDDIELPKCVEVYKTEHGGHIGFVGFNIFKEFRWMDNIVTNWIEQRFLGV